MDDECLVIDTLLYKKNHWYSEPNTLPNTMAVNKNSIYDSRPSLFDNSGNTCNISIKAAANIPLNMPWIIPQKARNTDGVLHDMEVKDKNVPNNVPTNSATWYIGTKRHDVDN